MSDLPTSSEISETSPKKSKTHFGLLITGALIGIFLLFAFGRNDPLAKERMQARKTIEICRADAQKYQTRIVEDLCEQMEEDFRRKFGTNP